MLGQAGLEPGLVLDNTLFRSVPRLPSLCSPAFVQLPAETPSISPEILTKESVGQTLPGSTPLRTAHLQRNTDEASPRDPTVV